MCGRPKHAARQKAGGLDVIIAKSFEAGGHKGNIAMLVLVLVRVIDAWGGDIPVIAAGGFVRRSQIAAALALGLEGFGVAP